MTPLDSLGVLAHQERAIEGVPGGLVHHELYTMSGLLTLLWHGDPAAPTVVLALGGAMGGLLGPESLWHDLGLALATDGRAQTVRIGYRRPNDLDTCIHDATAVAELACRRGGHDVVLLGHSFGGAVALNAAIALEGIATGVATFATQSGGCENAGALPDSVPLLLFHGDRDELLPPDCSLVVRELAGHGEVVILPGAGHLLTGRGPELLARVLAWLP